MKRDDHTPQRLILTSAAWHECLAEELQRRYQPHDSLEDSRAILAAICRRAGWAGVAPLDPEGGYRTRQADAALERGDQDDARDSALAAELRRRP